MKYIAISAFIILLAVPVLANQDGVIVGPGINEDFEFIPPARDLMDAWNDEQTPSTNLTYAGSCYGFSYIPDQNYFLERIEWYAGDIDGTVTVEIRDDGGAGEPNGDILASVTYQEVPPRGWQGENLDIALLLTAGTQYWVVYSVIVGSKMSIATTGIDIPHWWGNDCSTWSGPWETKPWMARFYGHITTPAAEGSWSAIKSLY